ncbi:MAG TPA: hypothetical protein VLA13_08670 [Massilibacterium sp.]|nr:hypothetical protein [Massilibacterium sp.]
MTDISEKIVTKYDLSTLPVFQQKRLAKISECPHILVITEKNSTLYYDASSVKKWLPEGGHQFLLTVKSQGNMSRQEWEEKNLPAWGI